MLVSYAEFYAYARVPLCVVRPHERIVTERSKAQNSGVCDFARTRFDFLALPPFELIRMLWDVLFRSCKRVSTRSPFAFQVRSLDRYEFFARVSDVIGAATIKGIVEFSWRRESQTVVVQRVLHALDQFARYVHVLV